jgi:hypothetical protein
MRRLIEWLWTAILLTALIVLSIGWPRSFKRPDVLLVFGPGGRPVVLTFGHGVVYLCTTNRSFGVSYEFAVTRLPIAELDAAHAKVVAAAKRHVERFNFLAGEGHPVFGRSGTWFAVLGLPLWLVWPPVAWLSVRRIWLLLRRRRRQIEGLCAVCGYDLRESPERCPECGTALPFTAAAGSAETF